MKMGAHRSLKETMHMRGLLTWVFLCISFTCMLLLVIQMNKRQALYDVQNTNLPSANTIHHFRNKILKYINSQVVKEAPKCGYASCDPGKPNMLNVHLVAHTHDDVGWLKTVDQYYYGAKNNIQHAGVQYILDTVVEQLSADPKKKFTYVEMAFFDRWLSQTHDSKRELVRGLVNQGRLQFALGGWSMNDEATTHYSAIIDQHTVGLKLLQSNYHDCGRPLVAWQIDPFGHSREMASLFAQMGYDAVYFARLDYQDRAVREKNNSMEFVWRGSPVNLGSPSDLFTGALARGSYGPPTGMCWDAHCSDTPIMDDDRMEDYNVDKMVKYFVDVANAQAKQFKTNHIMWTMGSDFNYQSATEWYKNLDKIIQYVNEQQDKYHINAMYSTPACYTLAKNKANATWTDKTDDFFPYAHIDHGFWTGYFTSRAALKGMVRKTNNFLQVAKQLDVFAQLEAEHSTQFKLDILRKAMGVAQHHDAVTGTEKQVVAYDYAMRLARGVQNTEEVIYHAYSKIMPISPTATLPQQYFCHLLNISECNVTEQAKQMQVVIYNPIGRPVKYWVQIPVSLKKPPVYGPDGLPVKAEVIEVTQRTQSIAERQAGAPYELLFQASVPPLGYATYFIGKEKGLKKSKTTYKRREYKITNSPNPQHDVIMKNEHISLTVSGKTGMLKSMTNLNKKITVNVSHSLMFYKSFAGNNSKGEFWSSGAYIFRPDGNEPQPISKAITTKVIEHKLVQELHITYSNWATSVMRLYEGETAVEFEWTVGPIPIGDKIGKEVISRFSTNLQSGDTFYTDANGREILQRRRDYRPTWKLKQTEPVAGNYYPVTSRIYIKDTTKKAQLTILTDRSQGGASIKSGQIELMVHRRVLHDDNLGVGEPLNETGQDGKGLIVRGKHYLLLDTIADSPLAHRDLGQKLYMAPLVSVSNSTMGYLKWHQQFKTSWSSIKNKLPDNVHLLTLEAWRGTSFLLRLEHFYEKNEDAKLSKPASVSIKDLFKPFTVVSAVELTLSANQKLVDSKRLKWNYKGMKDTKEQNRSPLTNDLVIKLNPMQIRTFQVDIKAGGHNFH